MYLCPECKGSWNPIFVRMHHEIWCSLRFEMPWERKPAAYTCTYCGGKKDRDSDPLPHYGHCRLFLDENRKPLYSDLTFLTENAMSVDGLIMRAAKVASEAHKDQKRKYSDDPYIFHPMRVAGRAMLLSGSGPIEVATAWLHDVLEDTSWTHGELSNRGIPEAVIGNVQALTNPSIKEEHKAKSREERKTIDRLWLSEQSIWIKKLKMIDRIDNLTELSMGDWEFMDLYLRETKHLVGAIGTADLDLKNELLGLVEYYDTELLKMHTGGF